ncbi:DNA polymerase III subunit beta [Paenibacillus marinisediminis]
MSSVLVHISKDSLINAVQHVLKAVSTNSPIPALTGVKIQADPSELIFTASNSSLTIQYRASQNNSSMTIARTGGIVVPARYFYEIIRKFDAGVVTLEIREHMVLTIISGHSQIRLCGMDPAEFPSTQFVESDTPLKFEIDSAQLKSSIKQVAASVSSSESRPVLTGVYFAYHNDSLHLVATDGIRLASRTIVMDSDVDFDAHVIIPGKNLYEVSRILDGEDNTIEIELGMNQIVFITGNIQIQSALIEGAYPSIKKVIPTSYVAEVVVHTSCFLNAAERETVLAGESIIRIMATSDKLDLLSRTAEIGDIQDEVPIKELNGEDFHISLNGKFLIDILRCVNSEYVRLRFTGRASPIIIQPEDDTSSTLFLITPVRTAN